MTSLAVRFVRSSTGTQTAVRVQKQSVKQKLQFGEMKALSFPKDTPIVTISRGGKAQVSHAVADQFGQLFPLRASVEVEALLGDALGVVFARIPACPLPPHAFLTKTPSPLHALLPQQGVIGLLVAARLVPPVLCVLAVINADRHLRLRSVTIS